MKQHLLVLVFFFSLPLSIFAGNKYWVGGSGRWNDPNHWSIVANGKPGTGIPSSTDNVILGTDLSSATDSVFIDDHVFALDFSVNDLPGAAKIILCGNGEIHIGGNISIGIIFNDRFSGKWILQDEFGGMRDNSTALIKTNGQVFTGEFIFNADKKIESTYSVSDKLYVNNSITINVNAELLVGENSTVVSKQIISAGSLINQGGRVLASNDDPAAQRNSNPQNPQTHTVTTVVTPNLCNGQCNATATAVVSGGSGTFTYLWSNSQTTQTATGLCAGTYLVVVTDVVFGDQVPAFAIVTDPPPIVIFFSSVAPLCSGQCNGSITASAAGGTGAFSYLWAPGGQTTATINGQCAGGYTITVTDANGCTLTQTFNLTQPNPLVANGTSANVNCFAACNGTASVAPTGGTAPYTYSWSPGGQTTPAVSGLCPGTYTCTITDAHNCTTTYVATITQPPALTVTMSHTNASCFGVCDGTATGTVSGGTSPYVYSWLPGLQVTPTINGQCAGTYTLNVTDANGCTVQGTVTITQPAQLFVAPTGVNITCFNACNGTAAANASGGTSPYTYNWSPSGGTGPTASNLCPGTYTVNVTDANGCTASGQVTINQPTQLLSNATGINITCFGACNGSATSNPSGGTSPYTYNWMPGSLNTQTIFGLCPGSYTLTVTDANNCTANATITITQPNQLFAGASHTNVSCNAACDGTATATPSGGVSPYSYNWQPGNFSTSTISGLCPGTYTLTVTDANGCTATQNVTITQPNPLSVTINSTQITCNSNCNGTAAAVVAGGSPTFTYLWSPGGQTTSSISALCVGTYTVDVTDANGCTTSAQVTLNQPSALILTPAFSNASCSGNCNGSASVTPSGGTSPYTYLWSPGAQTTSSINNLCAGTYTCNVTDAAGCTGQDIITITEPNALLANVTSINVSCNGGCNGSATANPNGGTGPYTYLWMPGGQTTNNVSGLCAGNYTVTITDVNGCTVNQQVNITQPPPLLAVVTSTTSSCNICNGTATVSPSGGTAPFAYFWTPAGGTNPTATNLCIGNYTVTVTDAGGCTATAIAVITPVVNIAVTTSGSNLTCFGSCNGTASANASGGTGPYSYNWSPIGQNTQTVSALCAGSYTVTATDANGCFNTDTITFLDPPLLTATTTNTNASCNAVCDATATATPSGGTGGYSYSWMPGGQTTQTATNLCAGSYTLTVTDANGCTVTQTITVTEPSLIVANQTVTNANCTLCDGSITANPSGGFGPYTYSWAPGAQTTQTISSLCPGIYTLTITDATGCSVNTQIAVSNIAGPTVTATSTNASCNAVCDGTGTATVTAGVSPYTYDWTPGNPVGDGTPNVSALCAGTYFCQVTDAVGCITFTSITITEPQPLTATSTITNVSCGGNSDGSITVNPSGGTGPYSYSWAPGGQPTQTISGLTAGTYTITITDANSCTLIQNITVTEPAILTSSSSFTNVLCNGACNGTGTITPVGGTSPYVYSWSSGQGTATALNLCPGTYTVDVTDANGCTTTQQVTITEPTPLVTSVSSTDATCNAVCDGTATVSASGGTPGYTYSWSPGGGTTPSVNNLCAGAYSIITSDLNGCTSVQSVTILQPTAIVLSASSGPLSCFGNCNGVASVNASGGTPGYTYSWAPGGQTTSTATALCSGTYTVTVTDIAGCVQTGNTTVTQPPQLLANVSSTPTTCGNNCDGTASANPVGGTTPYSYLWAPGGQTTATITSQCAGTYTVTVRDANGCQDIQQVTIANSSNITVTVANAPATCNACDGTMSVTPVGGTAPYTYSWSGGLPPQPNQTNLCAGIYTVTVTDANGCSSSFTLTLNNSGGPTGETVVTTPTSCSYSCDGTANVTPIGGTIPYTYLWNPGGQTVNSLSNMCGGNYFLQVTDANGCIRFSPVTITTPPAIVPNPFVANASCTGICDGSISLAPTGGTGAYTYLWSPGGQITSNISALCVGNYSCVITDANGCTDTSASVVNPWNTLTAAITSSNPGCNTSCNGTATVNITSGTAPFTFQWSDPIAQTTQTATGLCAGTYSVIVNDAGGCSNTLTVTLVAPSAITINPSITPTTCGQCNGSVTLNASGGTSPYTYLWSNGAPTSTVNSLCSGVYNVTVTDATGCSVTFTITVTSSGGPTITSSSLNNASCNGVCDGSLSVNVNGGIPPYTYLWLPGGQTTTSINNLCAGVYIFQARDSAGCTVTQTFAINEPSAIVLNQLIDNTLCGVCSGAITLTPSGGTGPYTYAWLPGGQTTSSINLLCAGIYTVTVTDANGCAQTLPMPVSNSNSGMVLTTTATDVSCNGSCNGVGVVVAAGGTGPYTYNWSNASVNDTASALCPGNYIVQATDASGCVASGSVTITQPTQLAGSIPFVQDELCAGACNGTITAIPSGGTMPYTYTWSNAQTTQTANSLCAGTYTVTIADANGCIITQTDTIISPIVIVMGSPVVVDASCTNTADGSITTTVSGGTLPYLFAWTGPNGYTANTLNISGLLPGSYTLVVTDANGCSNGDTVLVNALTPVVAGAGNDTTFCQNGNITLNATTSAGATYQWFQLPGNTSVGNTQSVTVIPPSGTTNYMLVVTNGACSDTDFVAVTSNPAPNANAGPDVEIITGMTTTLGGNPTGPNGTTFIWSPTTDLGNSTSSNPVASPQTTTTYVVYVTDANGCIGSDTVVVTVVPEINFPNGFTPNNDGINDVWVIDNIQLFPHCRVEVYNRWGELLFGSDGYNIPWDGKYKGQDLPVGTYYYIIKLNDPMFPQVYTGPITIMR
ncbi:MAG: gliding motility-associated C-terminal domain-containing protein [Bacteroidetes bacterium]|nr:gliding motility-associated C-terminal domain-containing protein [Bacteroidota bacterium]